MTKFEKVCKLRTKNISRHDIITVRYFYLERGDFLITSDLINAYDKIFGGIILPAVIEQMPQNGRFKPIIYWFDLDDRFAKEYFIRFEADGSEYQTIRRISISGLFPDGSGRMISNYIFKGTADEIVEFMKSDKAPKEISDTCISIDNSIKKHD